MLEGFGFITAPLYFSNQAYLNWTRTIFYPSDFWTAAKHRSFSPLTFRTCLWQTVFQKLLIPYLTDCTEFYRERLLLTIDNTENEITDFSLLNTEYLLPQGRSTLHEYEDKFYWSSMRQHEPTATDNHENFTDESAAIAVPFICPKKPAWKYVVFISFCSSFSVCVCVRVCVNVTVGYMYLLFSLCPPPFSVLERALIKKAL